MSKNRKYIASLHLPAPLAAATGLVNRSLYVERAAALVQRDGLSAVVCNALDRRLPRPAFTGEMIKVAVSLPHEVMAHLRDHASRSGLSINLIVTLALEELLYSEL